MLAGNADADWGTIAKRYSLVARPISATQVIIPGIPDTIGDAAGDGVPYNIAQPILAQQATQSMWGPDAYGFIHAMDPTTKPTCGRRPTTRTPLPRQIACCSRRVRKR